MNDTDKQDHPAWFRNPMVWMVILFPSVAVVAGITTLIIAANTEDGLVVDDYYKQGLEINRVIDHDRKAHELGLSAFVEANTRSGELAVSLSSKQPFIPGSNEITFKLIHRTRSGQDQTTVLTRLGDGLDYRGYLKPPIIEGRWTIHITSEDDGWRLKQNLTTRSAEHLVLNITS
jgi:hypothetical protein